MRSKGAVIEDRLREGTMAAVPTTIHKMPTIAVVNIVKITEKTAEGPTGDHWPSDTGGLACVAGDYCENSASIVAR